MMRIITLVAALSLSCGVRALPGVRARRKLLQLVAYGGEPDPSRFPLQLCEGDCDDDDQCDVGLICFHRDEPGGGEDWAEVPGCIGGSDFTAKTDFCIMETIIENAQIAPTGAPTPAVTAISSTAVPTGAVSSLMTGMPTETYSPTTATPSMTPTGEDYWDLPELEYISASPEAPLGLCQGDCDTDDECLDELICFQRASNELVPGCRGEDRNPTMDYCVKPPPTEEEVLVVTMAPTAGETPAATEMLVALQTVGDATGLPLGLCQGDCDTDDDCVDDLVCFQRDSLEAIPGCAGEGLVSYDYCVLDPDSDTSSPTATPLEVEKAGPP